MVGVGSTACNGGIGVLDPLETGVLEESDGVSGIVFQSDEATH